MATALKEREKYTFWEITTRVYCIFMLLIFPLRVDYTGYAEITWCKFRTFRTVSLIFFIVCGLFLIYSLIDRKKNIIGVRRKEIPFKLTKEQIIIMAYVLWNAFSALTSKYGKATWMGEGRFEGMFSCILYCTVFILVSMFGEYSDWYKRVFAVAGILFCLVAFLQFFKDGIIYPEGEGFWPHRFVSTIGNVDMVGGFIALLIPLVICSYVFNDQKVWNIVYLVAIGFLSFVLFQSDVDSGKVGVLVGIVFSICFLVDKKENLVRTLTAIGTFFSGVFCYYFFNLSAKGFNFTFGKKTVLFFILTVLCLGASFALSKIKFSFNWSRQKARRVAFIVLVAVVVLALIVIFFYKGDERLIKEMSEVLHFKLSDNAGSGRGYLWKSALGLAAKTPIKGNGPGTFGESYKDLDRFSTYTDFAHNDFIQIAVCIGFVGVAIYVVFLVTLAVRALKNAPGCKYIVILGSACAGYLAHSFFSFSLAIVTPMFWVLAGLLAKVITQVEES